QANAAKTGKIIIDGLREAAKRLPVVKDVRGKGLMFAVELETPAQAARFMEETKKGGLLVGKGGLKGTAIRMAPPLTLTVDAATEGLGIIVNALEVINAEAAQQCRQSSTGSAELASAAIPVRPSPTTRRPGR